MCPHLQNELVSNKLKQREMEVERQGRGNMDLSFMHLLPPDGTLKSGKHVTSSVSFITVKIRRNP